MNIILFDAITRMNIPESEIIKRSSVLIGFSGETKHTIREIKLHIYIKGVNYMKRFFVIDSLSSYNFILGRPWIRDMKAVPSTNHQCIKMPTPWGTVKIFGGQKESEECYKTSMTPHQAQKLKQRERDVLEARDQDMKEVPLSVEDSKAKVLIGSLIPEQIINSIQIPLLGLYTKKEANSHPKGTKSFDKKLTNF